jgi:hypothetical protein
LGSLIRILQISTFIAFDACASSATMTGLSHQKRRDTLNSHQAAASDGGDNQANATSGTGATGTSECSASALRSLKNE